MRLIHHSKKNNLYFLTLSSASACDPPSLHPETSDPSTETSTTMSQVVSVEVRANTAAGDLNTVISCLRFVDSDDASHSVGNCDNTTTEQVLAFSLIGSEEILIIRFCFGEFMSRNLVTSVKFDSTLATSSTYSSVAITCASWRVFAGRSFSGFSVIFNNDAFENVAAIYHFC